MEIWEQTKVQISEEEKQWRELSNKICIFYPEEIKELMEDVLDTLESKNVADFGGITREVIESILCIMVFAIDEKDMEKHQKKEEIASIRVLTREEARSVLRYAGRPKDMLKYLLMFYGERWEQLTKEQKIQCIIHELLHLKLDKPDNFRKHDRFAREYELMEKYVEAKNERIVQKAQIVALAQVKKKKKLPEEERD